MTAGEFIYNKRIHNNITVLSFAKILEIEPRYVYILENNREFPSPCMLEKIADILGFTNSEIEFLLSVEDSPPAIKGLLDSAGLKNKNAVSAIRVPLGLNLSKENWNDVVTHFNASII